MCAFKTAGFDDYVVLEDEAEEIVLDQYEIVSIPNDFNIKTIYDFIESGLYRIPGFQRNFVWDIGRSSRLIESLIIGLPVPQIFLYEKDRNLYQVIDGQQRLMSIYYFIKQRFPKKEKSVELRDIFDRETKIPDNILYDDDYFVDFKLVLKESLPEKKNVLKGKRYSTLDEYKNQFDYRTLRNIMIRVSKEPKENSAIYEIYNRLNTGGINLSPQEIRSSLFYSDYYDSLYKINKNVGWRRILNNDEPSLHLKDVEILLRGFAILIDGDKYTPSLTRFLNKFSEKGKTFDTTTINYLEQIFISFIKSTADLRDNSFINPNNNNFNIALYEAVFNAVCKTYYKSDYSNINNINIPKISQKKLDEIANNKDFINLARVDSTSTLNIKGRLEIAYKILNP